MTVRMRAGALEVAGADRWYVTDGANSVGPVRLDLLARGVEAGRVPLESFVRHEAWKVWRPLTDFTDFVEEQGSAPLPQFPLPGEESPRTRAVSGAAGSVEIPRKASLIEFASDEGVPSLSSSDGEGPESPAAAAFPESTASWSDPETELDGDVGFPEVGFPDGEVEHLESPTDVSRDLLGEDRRALAALFSTAPPAAPEGPAAEAVPAEAVPAEAVPTEAVPAKAPPAEAVPAKAPPAKARLLPAAPAATDDIPALGDGWGEARPADSADALPGDDLAGAADLSDALLLLLGGIIKRTKADVGLLFRTEDEGAKIVCAHGPEVLSALGDRAGLLDPSFVAAAAGNLVLSEPHPGPIGLAMMGRFEKLGVSPISALLLPIHIKGRLLGFLELGRCAHRSPAGGPLDPRFADAQSGPFTARDVVKAEDLVLAFAHHVTERGLVD